MRFSKATLQLDIQARVDGIQKVYGFDPGDGTHQIKFVAEDRKDSELQVAYAFGMFRSLLEQAQDYGLQVVALNYNWKPRCYKEVVRYDFVSNLT